MAWTHVVLYQGPNWEIHELTAGLAGDIEYVINHNLGITPLGSVFVGKDAQAGAASWWTDDDSPTVVHIHKAGGAPGAHVHVHIFTLRHPH